MLKKLLMVIVILTFIQLLPESLFAEKLVIADFDSATNLTNVGDEFGTWGPDPEYSVVGVRMAFDSDIKHGDKGNSVRVEYDIETGTDYAGYSDVTNPSEEAYNGLWVKLGKANSEGFDRLVFYIKGDEAAGYPTRIKVEIKNSKYELARYLITNITDGWKRVIIPFDKKAGIKDWSRLTEFFIKFDEATCDEKVGAIYIDDIYLSNE